MKESGYAAGDYFSIIIKYRWYGSPHKDYTVKVHSRHHGVRITYSADGQPNQLYTDGRSPSEFSNSAFCGMDKTDCTTAAATCTTPSCNARQRLSPDGCACYDCADYTRQQPDGTGEKCA